MQHGEYYVTFADFSVDLPAAVAGDLGWGRVVRSALEACEAVSSPVVPEVDYDMVVHTANVRPRFSTWRGDPWRRLQVDQIAGRQVHEGNPLTFELSLSQADFDSFYVLAQPASSLRFGVEIHLENTHSFALIRALDGDDPPEQWGRAVTRRLRDLFPWSGAGAGPVRVRTLNTDVVFVLRVATSADPATYGVSVTGHDGLDVISATVPAHGDPLATAVDWLAPHLDLIGDVLDHRRRDRDDLAMIEQRVTRLSRIFIARGLRAWWARSFAARRELTALTLLLCDLEDSIRFGERDQSASVRRLYESGELTGMRQIVEREIADNDGDQIGIWKQRLATLETLQARSSETIAVLAASILGGVAGALLTAAATMAT